MPDRLSTGATRQTILLLTLPDRGYEFELICLQAVKDHRLVPDQQRTGVGRIILYWSLSKGQDLWV